MSITEQPNSYRVALKSSAIIGGSGAVVALMNAFRAKGLAVLVGPSGIALFALYNSVVIMVVTIAAMGIATSGVRQIAEAIAEDEKRRIARVITTLRKNALCLGAVGAAILCLFSVPISRVTFSEERDYTGALVLLSICVFLTIISQCQQALLQGMRQIRDLAVARIVAAVSGTLVTITAVFILREQGIVAAMLATSGTALLSSWWFARRVHVPSCSIGRRDVWAETGPLLKLGFGFMVSSLTVNASVFLARIIVIRQLGLYTAGLYQAAYALSGIYVGFVLMAMSADFLPRLTAAAHVNAACNRLVNEQAEVCLLLAAAPVLATYSLAPFVVSLFYSADFVPAVVVLRWQIMGVLIQVLTWPMGLIMIAKGLGFVYFCTNLAYTVVYLLLFWFGIVFFGLPGAGMAFLVVHICQWLFITKVAKAISGFTWSKTNVCLQLIVIGSVSVAVLPSYQFSAFVSTTIGCIVSLAMAYFSLSKLSMLWGASSITDLAGRIAKKYGGLQ